MKTKTFILITLLLLSAGSAFCKQHTEEVKRAITRNFTITEEDHYLNVDNKYGQITIVEWDKPEIDFLIEITGKGETLKTAQAMADRVSVDFGESGRQISARTIFDSKSHRCNNCGTIVNYTVRVPRNIYFNLTNTYGNVNLETAYRDFTANINYGSLNIAQLKGSNNNINLRYGNLILRSAARLKLDIAYTNVSVDSAGYFLLNCAYSNMKAGKIAELILSSKYDKFKIASLGSATVNSGYSNFSIGHLSHNLCITELKYGKLRIEDLSPDFKKIDISARYSPVYIRMPAKEYNFQADLSTKYAHIKATNLVFNNVQFGEKDSFDKEIKGQVGKKSDAVMKISNSYADIILDK